MAATLSRRLSQTPVLQARLVSGTTSLLNSVDSNHARTLPPAPPKPISERIESTLKPIPRPPTRVSPTTTTPNQPTPRPGTATKEKDEESVEDRDDANLDSLFLRVLSQISIEDPLQSGSLSIFQLVEQCREKSNHVIGESDQDSFTIPYEPTPSLSRRVRVDGHSGVLGRDNRDASMKDQDGIVVVAHVVGGDDPKVTTFSGFAVGKQASSKDTTTEKTGQTLLTCSHTLDQIGRHLTKPKTSKASAPPSATFVLTSTGHIFTISHVLSSLPSSDLLLLRLSPTPIHSPTTSSPTCPPLRTLPISPYPPQPSTSISLHTYLNPLGRLKRKLLRQPSRLWTEGSIVEYRSRGGHSMGGIETTGLVGTYDELSSFTMTCLPTEGSSGGPIVDREKGCVVGITRGRIEQYGEKRTYGFATPMEKVLEMVKLPGFETVREREERRLTEGEKERRSGSKPEQEQEQKVEEEGRERNE